MLNLGYVTPYKMSFKHDTRYTRKMHPHEGTPGGQARHHTSDLYPLALLTLRPLLLTLTFDS